ncbi:alpha/beta fold hydrolase [Acidovorax sp. Root217]|uniref:alpha/beta fold hydrolase n=1 Tax=unclassified Acidovorax TaxID=2684926 RepID=UPI00070B4E84|nr:alpha/beta hydrolase [Acidovorax sp. Root217]KRC23500.1 alpha/beta hydrolase [Acidovorax sp. Root217]
MDQLTPSLQRWHDHGQFATVRGQRLFVAEAGQGSTLLLVHGYPTSSYDWHGVWNALAARYRVIAPDLLGMGFSDKPVAHAYRIQDHADLLDALLAQRGVHRCHIVAHDLGVSIAQEMLARRVERPREGCRIESLLLLNGGVCPEAYAPRPIQHLLSSPLGRWIGPRIPQRAFERTVAGLFGARTQPTAGLLDDFWALVNHGNGRRISHQVGRFYIERMALRDRLVAPLVAGAVPVRLVNGSADPNSGAHMAQRYREVVPHADVVALDGIGHWPQIEAPMAMLRALHGFVQSIDAPTQAAQANVGTTPISR